MSASGDDDGVAGDQGRVSPAVIAGAVVGSVFTNSVLQSSALFPTPSQSPVNVAFSSLAYSQIGAHAISTGLGQYQHQQGRGQSRSQGRSRSRSRSQSQNQNQSQSQNRSFVEVKRSASEIDFHLDINGMETNTDRDGGASISSDRAGQLNLPQYHHHHHHHHHHHYQQQQQQQPHKKMRTTSLSSSNATSISSGHRP